VEIFSRAQMLHSKAAYRLQVVSNEDMVTTDSGFTLTVHSRLSDTVAPDIFIIVGGAGVNAAVDDPVLLAWLAKRAGSAKRVVAISTGVNALARTRLAAGRTLAVHWQSTAELPAIQSEIRIDDASLYVQDGPLWTAVSASACTDMFLSMISFDHGAELARRIARELTLTEIRCGAFPQCSELVELFSGKMAFDRLHSHIRQNLDRTFTSQDLASFCGMSERTFMRLYRRTLSLSPAKAVDKIRATAAADLICQNILPTKRVARVCGFGSEETMRRSFLRNFGLSPMDYRKRHG